MTGTRPRQNTGNHPDPLAETFLITAAQLEELTTHAANASSGACDGSTSREKAAWKLFDSVVENVKAQPPTLTADFTRALPGGKLDDSEYEAIETALDRAGAPCQASDGRWLGLAERIGRHAQDRQALVDALKAAKSQMWIDARATWTMADFKNWAVIQQIDAALTAADGVVR